jgi:peptidoglycan/xylan/chitin deacetylase (PgdA/CDA1 family)
MRLPILMYHEIAPRPADGFAKYTVSPRAFAAQMAYLAAAGYTTVSLDEVLDHRLGIRSLPKRAVAITFDDGFAAAAHYAAPILARRRFRGTFFLVAGLIGKASRWLLHSHGFELPLMSWSTARRLESDGHRCESHAFSHAHLDGLAEDDCSRELELSRLELEDHLGRGIRHLAYPFGSYSASVAQLAQQAGYASACTVRIGRATVSDSALELPRIPITGSDSLLDFVCRLRTGATAREVVHARLQQARRLNLVRSIGV